MNRDSVEKKHRKKTVLEAGSSTGTGDPVQIRIEILRRRNASETPYWQTFLYTPEDPSEVVATALTRLNESEDLRDKEGKTAPPIRWECSCLQKKCGACAMVINGKPGLACDANLSDLGTVVRLEPLRKFPAIEDLMVDRSVLFRNLEEIRAWLSKEAEPSEKKNPTAHEASRCLQCGCCLEICPNFMPEGSFFGMASMVPAARILTQLPEDGRKTLAKDYKKHIYEGCGKSLSCRDICPAGIDIEELMSRSNAAAVWRSFRWKKRKGSV